MTCVDSWATPLSAQPVTSKDSTGARSRRIPPRCRHWRRWTRPSRNRAATTARCSNCSTATARRPPWQWPADASSDSSSAARCRSLWRRTGWRPRGTRTPACTTARRPRHDWKKSPCAGWSSCSGCRPEPVAHSSPARQSPTSRRWRLHGIRSSSAPAGMSRRMDCSVHRPSRSWSARKRIQASSRRSACLASVATASCGRRSTTRDGCASIHCPPCPAPASSALRWGT